MILRRKLIPTCRDATFGRLPLTSQAGHLAPPTVGEELNDPKYAEVQSEVRRDKSVSVRMSFTITIAIFFAGWIYCVMFGGYNQSVASPVEPEIQLLQVGAFHGD